MASSVEQDGAGETDQTSGEEIRCQQPGIARAKQEAGAYSLRWEEIAAHEPLEGLRRCICPKSGPQKPASHHWRNGEVLTLQSKESLEDERGRNHWGVHKGNNGCS